MSRVPTVQEVAKDRFRNRPTTASATRSLYRRSIAKRNLKHIPMLCRFRERIVAVKFLQPYMCADVARFSCGVSHEPHSTFEGTRYLCFPSPTRSDAFYRHRRQTNPV